MKCIKLLLLAAVALVWMLGSGCYTKKQAVRKFCSPSKEITKDSSWSSTNTSSNSQTLIWDSVSFIPKTMIETVFIPCDSLGRVIADLNLKLKSGTGTLTIKSDAGGIRVQSNCEAVISRFQKELQAKDSTIEVLSGQNLSKTIIPPTEIKEVMPWWVKPALILLGVFAAPTVFWLLWKLIVLIYGLDYIPRDTSVRHRNPPKPPTR